MSSRRSIGKILIASFMTARVFPGSRQLLRRLFVLVGPSSTVRLARLARLVEDFSLLFHFLLEGFVELVMIASFLLVISPARLIGRLRGGSGRC